MPSHRFVPFVVLLFGACASSPLRMVVLFRDANGLTVGDSVRVGRTHVGQVLGLRAAGDDQVAVEVQIDSPYRDRITEDAGFSVERLSLLGGGRYLAIEPGVGPVAKEGARLRGDDPLWQRLAGWATNLETWLRNPELRAKLERFAQAVAEHASQGRDAFAEARPALMKQAEELLALAKEEGPQTAEKVKILVQGLLDQK